MYFLLNLSNCIRSFGYIFSNFGSFYHAHLPSMVMSHDPRCKFDFFYFVLIRHLILAKVTKFLVENLSTLKIVGKKLHRESSPLVPLGG